MPKVGKVLYKLPTELSMVLVAQKPTFIDKSTHMPRVIDSTGDSDKETPVGPRGIKIIIT